MFFNRILYALIGVAIVIIGFSLWKMSSKTPQEIKKIHSPVTPTPSSEPSPTALKGHTHEVEIREETNLTDTAAALPTVMEVMDPNLPISHPKNVEARHKLTIARFKSWQTPEALADPRIQKFLEVMESEAYLELVKGGATFDELTNFMADQGVSVPRDPTQVVFRRFFPIGTPADYEPEMRAKVATIITEHGGDSSQVLSEFTKDERNRIWFLGYLGAHVNQRDMNLDHITRWVEDIRRSTLEATETSVAASAETPQTFPNRGEASNIDTVSDFENQQGAATSKDQEILTKPEPVPSLITESIEDLKPSDFELPTEESLKTALRTRLSPERFNKAMQTLNQYGPQEGLRHLKESDPELAKQVERLLPEKQETD